MAVSTWCLCHNIKPDQILNHNPLFFIVIIEKQIRFCKNK